MRLTNDFEVRAPIERVWEHLLDVERVAPCMPGAELTEIVDDRTWKGRVKMRIGLVSLAFAGTVRMIERDDANHRVQLRAEGREQRGQGSATAVATSRLESVEGGTRVVMETDLTITGKVAQYGRGMLGDISQRLTQDFANCLASNIGAAGLADADGPAAAIAEASGSAGGVSHGPLSGPGESAAHTEAAAAGREGSPRSEPGKLERAEPGEPSEPEPPEVEPSEAEPSEPAEAEPPGVPEPWTAVPSAPEETPPPHPVEVTPGVPAKPSDPADAAPRPAARPVQGFRLFAWALWRALVRQVHRLVDRVMGPRRPGHGRRDGDRPA
jgi:uncharacterized protein